MTLEQRISRLERLVALLNLLFTASTFQEIAALESQLAQELARET